MTTLSNRKDGLSDTPTVDSDGPSERLPLLSQKSEERREIREFDKQSGKIGWAILWLLGIPLPILLILYMIWGR